MENKTNYILTHSCKYQVVWCPKYRRKVLVDAVVPRLKELIEGVCVENGVEIELLEIKPDHVRLLLKVAPQLSIHGAVKAIKRQTSRVLRAEFPAIRSRIPSLWTHSYFVCTVGEEASPDAIEKYIEAQKYV